LDLAREHLLSTLLIERRLLATDELARMRAELEAARASGGRASLAALLIRDRTLDADRLRALLHEVEQRGRLCSGCARPILVGPGGPTECPACKAALGPLASREATPLVPEDGPRFPSLARPLPPPPELGSIDRDAQTSRLASGATFRREQTQYLDGDVPADEPRVDSDVRAVEEDARPTLKLGPIQPGASTSDPSKPTSGSTVRIGRALGKSFGPYEVLEELGSGGMGVVYKARHGTSGEVVALKVLLSGELAGEKIRRRFESEMRTARRLEHENIVPIYDVGEADGISYFTMKLINGDSLADLISRGVIDVEKGVTILRDVARAAHHAHERGVVHRDLKPANVIVEHPSGRPYLMDFGLAKDLESELHLSRTGMVLGTPHYMPPEQAEGRHRETDARTDVYSLGAILYELLAGRLPFEDESSTALLRRIVEEEPKRPSEVKPGTRPDLEAIALKALRKKKEERYASAAELADDLDRALRGERPRALDEPARATHSPTGEPGRNPAAWRLVLALGAVAVVAVALGVVAVHRSVERRRLERELAEKRRREEARTLEVVSRRAALEACLDRGEAKRALARSAPSAEAARALLAEAVLELTKALELGPESGDAAHALYARGLARRDLGSPRDLDAARTDLGLAAVSSGGWTARALAVRGVLAHRWDHDPTGARKDLEAAAARPDAPTDPGGKAAEEAAAEVARACLFVIDGDPPAARAALRKAEAAGAPALADEIAAMDAFVYLVSAPPEDPSWHAVQATKAGLRGLAAHRWRYDLLCEEAWARALAGDPKHAQEGVAAAKEACPEGRLARVPEAWIAAVRDRESDARSIVAEARREQPMAKGFWDALEAKLSAALDARHAPPRPGTAGGRALFGDLSLVYPGRLGPRVESVSSAIEDHHLGEALSLLLTLEKDDPEHASFALWRARLLLESGRDAEARAIVDAVIARFPDEPLAGTLLGLLESKSSNFGCARDAYRKCSEAHPELRTPRILLAQSDLAAQDWVGARDAVEPLVADDETDADAATLLAVALSLGDKAAEACEVARHAIDCQPRHAPVRIACARALRKLGRLPEGLAVLEEGERWTPGYAPLLQEKARVLRELNRTAEAEQVEKQLGK
jgi:tetratricopeptide (TPR) repeat protein/predicted Ser/Thr protein kinase